MDPKSKLNEAISSVDQAIHHHPDDTVEKIHQRLANPKVLQTNTQTSKQEEYPMARKDCNFIPTE